MSIEWFAFWASVVSFVVVVACVVAVVVAHWYYR